MSVSPVNAVYYPSWEVYKNKPPSYLDVTVITHIFYAFLGINEDGSLRFFDDWADRQKDVDGEKGCIAALSKLKRRHPHLKIIISVGGGAGSKEFPVMAASRSKRQHFSKEIRKFCNSYSFDGVDIDWEHPTTPEIGRNYLNLLHDLRQALPAPQFLLTSALPVGEWVLQNIDLRAAAHHLDLLNLMGYDFTGSWTDLSGHHAQLHPPPGDPSHTHPTLRSSCAAGIRYATSHGFPSGKILLGIPVYARYFPGARGPGHPFSGSEEMNYCDLEDGWVRQSHVNEAVCAASWVDHGAGGKGFVSFDAVQTVRMKAAYARSLGLGGLVYWHGAGDRRDELSLVAAGYHQLRC